MRELPYQHIEYQATSSISVLCLAGTNGYVVPSHWLGRRRRRALDRSYPAQKKVKRAASTAGTFT